MYKVKLDQDYTDGGEIEQHTKLVSLAAFSIKRGCNKLSIYELTLVLLYRLPTYFQYLYIFESLSLIVRGCLEIQFVSVDREIKSAVGQGSGG